MSVSKVWNDGNNADGKRPASVTVDLLRDGRKVDSAKIKAGDDGSWSHTFAGLAKYDPADGHEYTYTVAEQKVDGYESKVEGSAKDGFTITNIKTKTPPTPHDTPKGDLPRTGDASDIACAALVLGAAVLGAGVLFRRRA